MDLTPYVEATYDIDQPGWGHFYPHLTQTHSPMGYPTLSLIHISEPTRH